MTIKNNYCIKIFVIAIFLSFFAISLKDASAVGAGQSNEAYKKSPIMSVLCNAVNFISKGPGKVIAVLILISLAIALFLGKVTWGLAIAVGVGIGIMLGAGNILGILSGEGNPCEGVEGKVA